MNTRDTMHTPIKEVTATTSERQQHNNNPTTPYSDSTASPPIVSSSSSLNDTAAGEVIFARDAEKGSGELAANDSMKVIHTEAPVSNDHRDSNSSKMDQDAGVIKIDQDDENTFTGVVNAADTNNSHSSNRHGNHQHHHHHHQHHNHHHRNPHTSPSSSATVIADPRSDDNATKLKAAAASNGTETGSGSGSGRLTLSQAACETLSKGLQLHLLRKHYKKHMSVDSTDSLLYALVCLFVCLLMCLLTHSQYPLPFVVIS